MSELQLASEFSPRSGVYYYDIFIKNLRAGKITIKTEIHDGFYLIEVKGKTRKSISALYKIRYRGEVRILDDPVKPVSAIIENQSGSRNREVSVKFPDENKLVVTEKRSKNKGAVQRKDFSLESDTFILDPFSTLFIVRALDWELGMAEVFDVFSGKKQYQLSLICEALSQLSYEGQDRKVWVIKPQAISPDTPEDEKLANFEILLSKDHKREILMITGHPPIGKISAKLRKFTPLPHN